MARPIQSPYTRGIVHVSSYVRHEKSGEKGSWWHRLDRVVWVAWHIRQRLQPGVEMARRAADEMYFPQRYVGEMLLWYFFRKLWQMWSGLQPDVPTKGYRTLPNTQMIHHFTNMNEKISYLNSVNWDCSIIHERTLNWSELEGNILESHSHLVESQLITSIWGLMKTKVLKITSGYVCPFTITQGKRSTLA